VCLLIFDESIFGPLAYKDRSHPYKTATKTVLPFCLHITEEMLDQTVFRYDNYDLKEKLSKNFSLFKLEKNSWNAQRSVKWAVHNCTITSHVLMGKKNVPEKT